MKLLILIPIIFLTGCAYIQQLGQTVESQLQEEACQHKYGIAIPAAEFSPVVKCGDGEWIKWR